MRALLPLLAASLVTLAFSLAPGAPANPVLRPPLRLECAEPHTLLLHRFEDGSARLECAGRILVRISVPG